MKVKITTSLALKTLIPLTRKAFINNDTRSKIIDAIDASVGRGRSPVLGKRWKPYSDSYAKKKGRKKPVDMKLTGDMRKSLKARKVLRRVLGVTVGTKNALRFFYNSETAKYHEVLGAGQIPSSKYKKSGELKKNFKREDSKQTGSVVRRLLPYKNGERFNKTITNQINRIFRKSVADAVRTLNRR